MLRFDGSPLLRTVVKLFRRGHKMRLLAFSQIWNAFSGRYSTYRYEELHQQQLLNWGIEERGRYSSYRGMLSVSAPSSHQTSSCVRVSSDVLFF